MHQPEQVTKADHVGHVSRDRSMTTWMQNAPISMATNAVPWQQAPLPWQRRTDRQPS